MTICLLCARTFQYMLHVTTHLDFAVHILCTLGQVLGVTPLLTSNGIPKVSDRYFFFHCLQVSLFDGSLTPRWLEG